MFAETTEEIIVKLKRKAAGNFANARTSAKRKMWKAFKMETMAARRVQVGCYGNMSIYRSFMLSVLDNMAARVSDLLLLT